MEIDDLLSEAAERLRAGKTKEAVVLLKPEASRSDGDLRVRSLYGVALAQSDISIYGFYRGLRLCSEALKKGGEDPYLLVNLGKVNLYHGLREKAIQYMDRALTLAPDDPMVRAAREELGFRQRPKIPFMKREHRLNRFLGYLAVSAKRLFSRFAQLP
ncbi:MAG: hypothetical protein R3231_04825 [bacterium]|nr:hypothetical protein [bacterium]